MAKKAKKGDCYEAAGRLALEFIRGKHPKAVLVHGVALNSLDYKPMGHAWVEVGGTVYDYSNGQKIKKSKLFYYNMGAIDGLMKRGYKQFRYTGDDVALNVLKKQHWGPWENTGAKRQELTMGYNPFDYIGKDKRKRVDKKSMVVAKNVVTEYKLKEMIREILRNEND